MPEDLAVELLGLADRYLLNDLKLLCGFTLARMISVETVCRIVQAADRWDARDSQLRAQCIECAMRRASDTPRTTASARPTPPPHLPLLPLQEPMIAWGAINDKDKELAQLRAQLDAAKAAKEEKVVEA